MHTERLSKVLTYYYIPSELCIFYRLRYCIIRFPQFQDIDNCPRQRAGELKECLTLEDR